MNRRPLTRVHQPLSEKAVERLCDQLITQLGGEIVRFSQSRASRQTEGIPDRRYRINNRAFWFEVKAADGRLSEAQIAYYEGERACHEEIACGDVDSLRRYLNCEALLRRSLASSLYDYWWLTPAQRRKEDAP